MSFDVFGPTRHVRASTVDDGREPVYDLLTLPRTLNLFCPQLDRLHQRFYESTVLDFTAGEVHAVRDELVQLQAAYRTQREPELVRERQVRARDATQRRAIVERLWQEDAIDSALEAFRQLCTEAIHANADVRCIGD